MGARCGLWELPGGVGDQSRRPRGRTRLRTRQGLHGIVRGRRSRTLYGETFEPLLDRKVGEMREAFVRSADGATAGDAAAFALTALSGVVIGFMFMAIVLPLVPVGLVATWLRRRQQPHAA